MGWLFTAHQRKAELVRERTAPWQTEEVRGTTLAHCIRGQCLWKVVEIEHEASSAREHYIALDLLAYQGGTWGYKDLHEAEHPYYYSCPLGYLKLVPAECEAWREGVRAYHRRFTVGQCVPSYPLPHSLGADHAAQAAVRPVWRDRVSLAAHRSGRVLNGGGAMSA